MTGLREALARSSSLVDPVAQAILARDPELHQFLVTNPNLSDEVWIRLYRPRPRVPVGLASRLLAHPLSQKKLEHALRFERRPSLLQDLAHRAPRDEAVQSRLLDVCSDDTVANWLLWNDQLHPRVARRAAELSTGRARLSWMVSASRAALPASVARRWLHSIDEWSKGSMDSNLLATLLDERPELLAAAARSPSERCRMTAASCRHLLDPSDQWATLGLRRGSTRRLAGALEGQAGVVVSLLENPNTEEPLRSAIVSSPLKPRVRDLAEACTYPAPVTVPWEEASGLELESVLKAVTGEDSLGHWSIVLRHPRRVLGLAGNRNMDEEQALRFATFVSEIHPMHFRPGVVEEAVKRLGVNHPGLLTLVEDEGAAPVRDMWLLGRGPAEPSAGLEELPLGTLLRRHSSSAAEWVCERLDGSPGDVWEVVLSVCDGFEGTLPELLEVPSLLMRT